MERDYKVAFGRALDQATEDIGLMADHPMIRIKQREGMITMNRKEETR
jgi:hypothetical protein